MAAYETEARAERIAGGQVVKTARIEAIVRAGGTPPEVNKGGRTKGTPNKVTPTVERMILTMKAEKNVAHIAWDLILSR